MILSGGLLKGSIIVTLDYSYRHKNQGGARNEFKQPEIDGCYFSWNSFGYSITNPYGSVFSSALNVDFSFSYRYTESDILV